MVYNFRILEKDQSTVTVTTSKEIAEGTKRYYLIVYSTKEDNKSCGYKIVELNFWRKI